MVDLAPAQTSIHAALAVAPATYPTYDAVPPAVLKPYFVIGEVTMVPDEELAAASGDASFTLHAWSAYAGKKQAYEMLAFARARLDNKTISGAWACSEDFVEVMEDRTSTTDKRVYHGVARYRLRLG